MLHLAKYGELLELEISYESVLTKKNYLKKLLATSFFELVRLFFYLEYDFSIQTSKAIQVKHLDQATARAGILMFYLFNVKPLITN